MTSAPGIAVRTATPDDLAVLREMWIEAETWFSGVAHPEPIDPRAFDGFAAMAFGEDPWCTALVAEVESEVAGHLVYHRGYWMSDFAPALFVADLFVRPPWHRHGIGSALMHHVRDLARSQGARRLYWTVWRQNLRAQHFYRTLGAEPFDEEIFMRWSIAP